MLRPITTLTADEILTYTGINLSSALVDDDGIPGTKSDRYIRDVTFLVENFIKQRTMFAEAKIANNPDAIKTAVCYQIEYQQRNGELQKYALVDVRTMSVGRVSDLQSWVVSPEVERLLEVNGLLWRGIR